MINFEPQGSFFIISGYANLKGVTEPKKYLENIKNDGYATSVKYVGNLMAVIENMVLLSMTQTIIL